MITLFNKRLELEFTKLPDLYDKWYKCWCFICNTSDVFCGRFFYFTFYLKKRNYDLRNCNAH